MWDQLAVTAAKALCVRTLAGVGDSTTAHWSEQESITMQLRRPMNVAEIKGLSRARPLPVETGHDTRHDRRYVREVSGDVRPEGAAVTAPLAVSGARTRVRIPTGPRDLDSGVHERRIRDLRALSETPGRLGEAAAGGDESCVTAAATRRAPSR